MRDEHNVLVTEDSAFGSTSQNAQARSPWGLAAGQGAKEKRNREPPHGWSLGTLA